MDDHSDGEERKPATHHPQESGPERLAPVVPNALPAHEPIVRAQSEVYHRAGFWLRTGAFIIDMVVLGVFSGFLLLAAFLISVIGADSSNFDSASLNFGSLLLLCQLAEFTATAAYFTILHGETGQTIGKSLLGLEVCTLDGQSLGYGHALLRFLAYLPSFFLFGLGFLWVGLNPGKRGWHDLLSGTMVVVDRDRE